MDSTDYSSFRRKLLKWYGNDARDLPWRRTADPYQIWISEIMLQQTTVAAVIPYFERFLDRFPTVAALAAGPENEVLRLWEGLGYYSRARNLHRAAKVIVEEYAGLFPSELNLLQALPGIGRYTAGAIASFAFDQRAPIVEANTLRLYCRLIGFEGDPRSRAGQEVLWSFAESILPRVHPGRFNQALMELGALICAPREPDCAACPARVFCRAHREGSQLRIPQPKQKVVITHQTEASIAIRKGAHYLLRERKAGERWAGLWDFVRFEIEPDEAGSALPGMIEIVAEKTGFLVELEPQILELTHSVTRYRITLKCYVAKLIQGKLTTGQKWKWVPPAQFDQYPLSVTARQFAKRLQQFSISDLP